MVREKICFCNKYSHLFQSSFNSMPMMMWWHECVYILRSYTALYMYTESASMCTVRTMRANSFPIFIRQFIVYIRNSIWICISRISENRLVFGKREAHTHTRIFGRNKNYMYLAAGIWNEMKTKAKVLIYGNSSYGATLNHFLSLSLPVHSILAILLFFFFWNFGIAFVYFWYCGDGDGSRTGRWRYCLRWLLLLSPCCTRCFCLENQFSVFRIIWYTQTV